MGGQLLQELVRHWRQDPETTEKAKNFEVADSHLLLKFLYSGSEY